MAELTPEQRQRIEQFTPSIDWCAREGGAPDPRTAYLQCPVCAASNFEPHADDCFVAAALSILAAHDALVAQLQLLRGATAADEARLRTAAVRVWGEDRHGCDTPEWLADEVEGLRAQLAQVTAERDALAHGAALLEARTQRGVTDCSTPLHIRVDNIVAQLERLEAEHLPREDRERALNLATGAVMLRIEAGEYSPAAHEALSEARRLLKLEGEP